MDVVGSRDLAEWSPGPPFHLTPDTTAALALGAVVLGAFAFNWTGGGAIVGASLSRLSPTLEEEEDRSPKIAASPNTTSWAPSPASWWRS